MVGVVVLSFLICWFPFALMYAVSPLSKIIESFFAQPGLEEGVIWLGKLYKDILGSSIYANYLLQLTPTPASTPSYMQP